MYVGLEGPASHGSVATCVLSQIEVCPLRLVVVLLGCSFAPERFQALLFPLIPDFLSWSLDNESDSISLGGAGAVVS